MHQVGSIYNIIQGSTVNRTLKKKKNIKLGFLIICDYASFQAPSTCAINYGVLDCDTLQSDQ